MCRPLIFSTAVILMFVCLFSKWSDEIRVSVIRFFEEISQLFTFTENYSTNVLQENSFGVGPVNCLAVQTIEHF